MAFLVLLTLVIGGVWWIVRYPTRTLQRIEKSGVVGVRGAADRYPNLPLDDLSIYFSYQKNSYRVQVIFPELTRAGDVRYIYSWHDLRAIYVPNPGFNLNHSRNSAKLAEARKLAILIGEHLQIERKIEDFKEERHKILNLLDLIATSDLYGDRKDLYKRALVQIEELLQKAKKLEKSYIRFVKELLVGREIADYDPALLPSDSIALDSQYERIRDEYRTIKDTTTAYAELLRARHV